MTPFAFGFTVDAMVTVRLPLPSASDTVTSVPSPPLKLTSLPGLTIPFEVPSSEIFQPLALIASATAVVVAKPDVAEDDLPSVVENVPFVVLISNLLLLALVVIKLSVAPTTDKR
ncbi:Uncharacterised protein [Haemophilus haemolyticus]|nr:Uncharacterised protein [Haemophilus haemolyticus]